MASPASPMQASLARQLIQRLAQGQGGATPDAAGQQLGAQFAELAGADPSMMLKAANQIKAMLTAMIPRTSFNMPEAARHAGQAMKSVDSMIKSLQEGAAAQMAAAPIVNNAALPNMGDMGSSPDQGMTL